MRSGRSTRVVLLLAVPLLAACGDDRRRGLPVDAGGEPPRDAASAADAGGADGGRDGGVPVDAGLCASPATFYRDSDGDGHGDAERSTEACAAPEGFTASSDDCDDRLAASHPGATEICDGADNDCDGSIDEEAATVFYEDPDGDGYGVRHRVTVGCEAPEGYAAMDGDCDEESADVNPGAAESCNDVDDDCDGSVDEGVLTTWYADADADGWGDPTDSVTQCDPPAGVTTSTMPGDCNDDDPDMNPGLTEVCDGKDNDCDGPADEGLPSCF